MKNGNIDDLKFKKTLKKVVNILSILIYVIAFVFSIYCFITSFTMGTNEFFGPLANIFVFFGGFASLIYAVIINAFLLLLYAIIIFIYDFYNKLNSVGRKKFFVGTFCLILFMILFLMMLTLF